MEGPEFRDLREVRGPIVDSGVEDGAEDFVLTDIGVEGAEQGVETGFTTDLFEEGHRSGLERIGGGLQRGVDCMGPRMTRGRRFCKGGRRKEGVSG